MSSIKRGKIWVLILGTIIDIKNPQLNGNEISKRLINYLNESEEIFFNYLDYLSGRYLILYNNSNDTKILSDATGMRSIFYSKGQNIIASHCKLVNDYVKAPESTIVNKKWLRKYSNYHLPGHFTPYENILFLTPNTLLCINTKEIIRFFPREPLKENTICESADTITSYVKNQLAELANRDKKLLLSLSAGSDSRTSLAFTKEYRNKFTYFTYSKENYKKLNNSIKILQIDKRQVQDMVSSLGLNHKFVSIDESSNIKNDHPDYYSAIQSNTFTHHNFKLAKQYYEHFRKEYLHIRTNITEIGKNYYKKTKNIYKKFTVDAMVHAYSRKALDDERVKKAFESFYQEVEFNNIYNYDPYSLFYWEYRMGTWHTQLLLESDIAHDTFILFNAREILKKFLSIPSYAINEQKLFYTLIEKNWAVLNYWKINQLGSISDEIDSKIDNYGLNLRELSIKGGSTLNSEKEISVFSEKKNRKASYFMETRNPQIGDFVDAELKLKTSKNQSYYCIVQLRSPYENRKHKGRLKYQVILNNGIILEEDISDWKESNHIHIKFISLKEGDVLNIRTIALKDCEKWGWGRASMVYIERIVLRNKKHNCNLSVTASSPYTRIVKGD
ncbi:hypothetical protein [Pseudogracilibacillus auburnensis]|uniref:hypothetical protein n=1 Tax=Pseudogracilibacillus auburnensis TaxID=1494959 RepID=UPI001A95B86C|nr:hypothetical protein [Pseudogracilibacillus auburnensis]MBO1005556.1 hypothetical protein [Pseudogracilibacillus auburnensis]